LLELDWSSLLTAFDWSLVVLLNGAIIVYGLFLGRETKSASDWFLAGRRLPWWIVGLSLYATAIDSSDLVADSGGTYNLGLSYFVTNWVGTVVGWVVAAHFIVLPMYNAGMYTNAEYLEARFGPTTRLISALVQVQYRTLVLGIIATTIYLTVSIVFDWKEGAWWVVASIAVLATIYTAWGGLRSVAVTDALQSVVMLVASVVLFVLVWSAVGGWSGIEDKLAKHDPDLPAQMLHVGHERIETEGVENLSPKEVANRLLLGGEHREKEGVIKNRTPAWLFCIQFLIAGMAYSVVNHTQSMRLLGSRSKWDLKMSVVVAGSIMLAVTFFNLMMGVMGRALYPELHLLPVDDSLKTTADVIYPILVRDFTGVGLKGLVVAGVLAAAFSTYDSIGSTLSSLLTRDVYARFLVRDRDDRHYLWVGQWLTPMIIGVSFLYVPFLLEAGMLMFYLNLVSAFVVPLLTVYLMGAFTRVHRKAGTVGLLCGVLYGAWRLLAPWAAEHFGIAVLPIAMINESASTVFSMLITSGAMIIISLRNGWEPRGELRFEEGGGWLRDSQQEAAQLAPLREPTMRLLPAILGGLVIAIGVVLSFVVFW
jgi:SSS family solute:Na+ symporter